MITRSESDIEQRHRQDAIAAGWMVVKIMHASPNGMPDRFYAKAGRVVLIEWKKPGGPLRKQQEIRIKELRNHGVEVHVVDNVAEANRILGIGYQSRLCKCGCGRRFTGDDEFAFDVCRISFQKQDTYGL